MNLSNDIYLRSAFRELDAFAIEGIGTFKKLYHSAHEETYSGELHPPRIEIEFTEEVDEALLLDYYLTDSVHLDKKTASRVTENIYRGIESSIATQGYYEITGVGKLKKSTIGSIYFVPLDADENVFSSDFYGLQPVQLHTRTDFAETKTSENMNHEDQNFEPVSNEPKGYWFGWKAAAFLGVVLLFGLFLFILDWPIKSQLRRASVVEGLKVRNVGTGEEYLAQGDMSTQNSAQTAPDGEIQPTEELDQTDERENVNTQTEDPFQPIASNDQPGSNTTQPSTTKRSLSDEAETTSSNSGESTRSRSVSPSTDTPSGVSRGGQSRGGDDGSTLQPESNLSVLDNSRAARSTITYHVISSSLNSRQAANEAAEVMRRKGYTNVEIVNSSSKYRVSIYQSKDRDLAEAKKTQFRRQGINDAWILEEKP